MVLALSLMGILFYWLRKESGRAGEEKAMPIVNFKEYKKEMEDLPPASPASAQPLKSKTSPSLETRAQPVNDDLDAAKKQLAELEKDKEIAAEIREETLSTSSIKVEAEYRVRVVKLEEELRTLGEKSAAEAREARQKIDVLQKENEELKRTLAEKPAAPADELTEAKALIASLQEKFRLAEEQLTSRQTHFQDLENQIVKIQKEFQTQLGENAVTIERLKAEQYSIVEMNKEALTKEQARVEELNHEWRLKVQALDASLQTLKTENTQLLSQQQQLQYLLEQAQDQRNDRLL